MFWQNMKPFLRDKNKATKNFHWTVTIKFFLITFKLLKNLVDVMPVYKKSDPTLVLNYRPISVLPTMSKAMQMTQLLMYAIVL